MTQVPPPAKPSSRPPPALRSADGGRRVTALAAGGSVLLLSAAAVALWPRTYGTEATFVLDGGANVGNPVALAGRIEATLLEREELAQVAMELPPELRSPDPIGRLRAGIRVQSRAPLGFVVEFRGSDPQSVQRIANRLVDRSVALVPKLTTPQEDADVARALAERTRAVTEFLTAHPEVTLDQTNAKGTSSNDSGLDALRTEKRQLEQRLANGTTDNPYADPGQNPELLNRRLNELKTTITRRETALKQPRPASLPTVAPELTSKWRTLLAELATAQANANASTPSQPRAITAHVTARAPLPSSPLTPNRLVLSIVAALLSVAAALVAYVLPRKPELAPRSPRRSAPNLAPSDPPPAPAVGAAPQPQSPRSEPPAQVVEGPKAPSNAPPKQGSSSEPPGPIAVQRTVVVSAASGSTTPNAVQPKRSQTVPGGLVADSEAAALGLASTTPSAHPPPPAPLLGSRPPPGAGSYSVSSSHPPPMERGHGSARTSVEHLSPLPSARPPAYTSAPSPSPRPSVAPPPDVNSAPQIMSRPPALDPEAEQWAARFETAPPASPPRHEQPKKRSGRWKTQVMGSMVPLEVLAAREERAPLSEEPESFQAPPAERVAPPAERVAPPAERVAPPAQAPTPSASTMIHHDVPSGWSPKIDAAPEQIGSLRDAILQQGRRLNVAVTGAPGAARGQLASALALALSQSGARVLLVEGDFDAPDVHQVLSISAPTGAGFSQQLMARRHDKRQQPWVVVRCSPNLHVLAEGRLRSPGLLASEEFQRAIRELHDQHHVVVIHAPSLDNQADLRRMSGLAHAVIVADPKQPAIIQFGDNALGSLL